MAKARLRHFAISTADPEKTAQFYKEAFGMEEVGRTDSPIAHGVYLSDGVVNLAVLKYRSVEAAGTERGLDWYGLHHVGFWVDDCDDSGKAIERAGGRYMMGEVADSPTTFYEVKYRGPDGVICDISANGWRGARKDVPDAARADAPAPAK